MREDELINLLPGDVVMASEGDRLMKRVVLMNSGGLITTKIIRCDWSESYVGLIETFDYYGWDEWQLDEVSRIRRTLEAYEEV